MPIDRYCTIKECRSGESVCMSKHRAPGKPCVYEYVAADMEPEFRWLGEGPPPARWMVGNTMVYRTFADACD